MATLRIVQATLPHGIEHVVFHRADAPTVGTFFSAVGVNAVPFTPPTPSLVRHLPGHFRASKALAQQFGAARLSGIHAADMLAAQMAGLAGHLAGLPLISHVRNQYRKLPVRDCLLLSGVERFVFVSRQTRDSFACARARRVGEVLYDGIDVVPLTSQPSTVRAAVGLPADALVIGMVARIAPQKDFLTLIEALRRLRDLHPTAHLLLVGDSDGTAGYREHHAQLTAVVREAGLADRVHFTGHRTDVPALLSAMDIFALVTHAEGLPLVILEAMAQGLPVVATAVDGIPEVVEDGVTGLLHPHQDASVLASQLGSLLSHPARRRQLGEAGRLRARTTFSREQFAQGLVRLYHQFPSHPWG